MSRGNDTRSTNERSGRGEKGAPERGAGASRTSRSSIPMSVERARAIQSHSDSSGTNEDFKARAMSAADRNDLGKAKGE